MSEDKTVCLQVIFCLVLFSIDLYQTSRIFTLCQQKASGTIQALKPLMVHYRCVFQFTFHLFRRPSKWCEISDILFLDSILTNICHHEMSDSRKWKTKSAKIL